MESSNGLEGSGSSVSGWTMYIGSPMHEEDTEGSDYDDDDDAHNEQVTNQNKHDADEDDYSDDSLVSDASSGPSQHEQFVENGEGSHIVHLKHDKSKNHNTADSYSACKKANEQEKKRNETSIEVKNEDLVLVIKSATTAQVLQGK